MLTVRGTKEHLLLISALLLLTALPALAVQVDIGEGAGTVGDIVTVPVTVDDLTGLGVFSYEVTITWYASRLTLVDVPVAGTLSAPWGPVTFNSQDDEVRVCNAGGAPLSGAGTLFELTFELGPASGNAILTLADVLFNEGTPPADLSNGFITVSALPTISILPNYGEIAVGELLPFTAYYGTAPYTYGSTDPAVASFTDDDLLGVWPGSVLAFVEDAFGVTDTTSGTIDVRALRLSVGDGLGMPGDVVVVPVDVGNTTPFDIRSAEFTIDINYPYVQLTGVITTGTLVGAANWSTPVVNVQEAGVSIALAGVEPLVGGGTLIYLEFTVLDPPYSMWINLTPVDGMFNEIYPPVHEYGGIQITDFPVLSIYPNTVEMVVGDTEQFAVSGSGTPPYDWSVTDPVLADINTDGLLTALDSGVTRVAVDDAVGATDTTDVIRICDLYLLAPSDTVFTSHSALLPIQPDRDVTGLGIMGYELTLTYNPLRVDVLDIVVAGTSSAGWGMPVVNMEPGEIIIVNAGVYPLETDLPLLFIEMIGTPELYGSSSPFVIEEVYFNEGDPCALVIDGIIELPVGVPESPPAATLTLKPNYPNPFNPWTSITYNVGEPGPVRIAVYSIGGSLVRELVNHHLEKPGEFVTEWDGLDDRGRRMSSGVYICRLEGAGDERSIKMVMTR
ncbi:MAG: hypothetical protein GY835_27110 [bacterium]|nr:hypothetical protein [bacterium]